MKTSATDGTDTTETTNLPELTKEKLAAVQGWVMFGGVISTKSTVQANSKCIVNT